MKTNYPLISLLILCLGLSIANAAIPSNSPTGSPSKNGIFYTYFENISKTTTLPNPFLLGFGIDYSVSFSDGNNLIRSFLGTLGGGSSDIVTGFDTSGNITKTTISTITRKYLGDNVGVGSIGEGIVGFSPSGSPLYSKEIGYWGNTGGILIYNGGVQIGSSIIPSSLNVVGNITVLNSPSASDDLITKSYADTYMKDICTRFLGSWNDTTATCSSGAIAGPTCIVHACDAVTPACGATTTGTSDSCGTPCSKTGPACAGPNSCSATTPSCNGTTCTITTGTPSSANQAWLKGSANCGFSCTGGYTGGNCEIAPLPPKCYDVQITYNGNPAGPDYAGSAGSYGGTQRCYSNNYSTQKAATDCSSGTPSAPLSNGGFASDKCVYTFMGSDWWGHFSCVETTCTPASNSCSSGLPSCNGTSCTTTIGTPSSVNQAWVQGSANCGFSCTGGYTGTDCEIPPVGATCFDGIENGSETGVDCGGSCGACVTLGGSCSVLYYVKPFGATNDMDITPGTSHTFASNIGFSVIGSDLNRVGQKFTCPAGPSCSDGIQNGSETGVDCGGSCSACSASPYVFQIASTGVPSGSCGFYHGNNYPTAGQTCNRIYPGHVCSGGDGKLWKCELPVATPTCFDGIENGSETGVDCGGSCGACTPLCVPGVAHQILTGGTCVDCDTVPWSNVSFGSNTTSTQRACYTAFHNTPTDCTASDGHIIPSGQFYLDSDMKLCDDGVGVTDVTDCGTVIDPVHIHNVPDHASPIHKRYWCDRG